MNKTNPSTLCIIPARGSNDQVSSLNLRELNGKPLIQYTIEAAKKTTLIDVIMVSTEDQFIADLAKLFGATVPFLRPKELTVSSIKKVVQHTLQNIQGSFDLVIVLWPNCPFRQPKDIDSIIEHYISHKFDFVISMIEDEDWIWVDENGFFKCISRPNENLTQRSLYRGAGGMEVGFSNNYLAKDLYSSQVGSFLIDRHSAITIHSLYDLLIAERLIRLPRSMLNTLGVTT